MSEKGKEIEKDEREMFEHWSHEHPLSLVEACGGEYCYGCEDRFSSGEQAYGCSIDGCDYSNLLHEECATMARKIRHPSHHPQHILIQQHEPVLSRCYICEKIIWSIGYKCTCSECEFEMHLRCSQQSGGLIKAVADDGVEQIRKIVRHPSHPDHEMKLLRRRNIGKDIIHLPANEVAGELITPFVMRQRGGETLIPPIIIPASAADELMKVKYKFIHHQHQLTLLSSANRSQEEEEEEDEENYGVRSELICDGCITHISLSSNYYMSCGECKYNLHLACFHLPPQLSSLPVHQRDDHQLVLQSLDKHQPWRWKECSVCEYVTNGLFYTCTNCSFKVNIQCACMPDTIHHAAHPRHLLKHVTQSVLRRDINRRRLSCAAGCDYYIDDYDCYRCSNNSCDFIVHVRCALLPVSVSSRRWDEHHPLLLTYNATQNHPGDFYCDQCETGMNPRSWMYHCRACDISFHPKCFPTTSGEFRNKKLGQKYVNDAVHQHPLTFQLLTTKRCCDICGRGKLEQEGFYCAFCNFFICYYYCSTVLIRNAPVD
ncbi:uncharacterized protein LOC125207001 [Salvia hispanica]|uniref:uncharacterized protein LOC125207001 n=1 Tax=Salvia hispanica TaxID=49212 RepID=UPI002009B177|nr:uncharacterized protein LOC125207001 [Salvia hispanica]